MATVIWRDANIFVDTYDLTGYHNKVEMPVEAEMKDATVFGNTTRVNKPGLLAVSVEAGGFFDTAEINAGTDDSLDQKLFASMGLITPQVTIAPVGPAEGSKAYAGVFASGKYNVGAAVGDLLGFQLSMSGRQKPVRSTVLFTNSSRAASADSAAKLLLGAVSATQRVYAFLHVLEFDGTSLDVIVRSDTNTGAGGETTRLTFTQALGRTSQQVSAAGAITDTYWDVSTTFVGTSFKALVVVGIQ